jgi:XTP/dITP diphosphohydrolase
VEEVGAILAEILGWDTGAKPHPRLVSLRDFPDLSMPDEDGDSYRENAQIKARAAADATGLVSLADDSGIEVDALSGAPGIHSARWLDDAPQHEKNRHILDALKGNPPEARTARFRCAVAVCPPNQAGEAAMQTFEAALEGTIAEKGSGAQGFGYDPIFIPDEASRPGSRTLAEYSAEEKNRISHRALALRRAAESLTSLL